MANNNFGGGYGANQYKTMAVKTATPGQILIMLYEGAIQNVKKASAAIDRKDIPAKGQAIVKTHDIINELQNTLNFEVGGEIAVNLDRLYTYITEQLVKANVQNSKEPLIAVQKMLETLLSGWKEAVAKAAKEAAQAAPGKTNSP